MKTLQVLVSFGAVWDLKCHEMVAVGWFRKMSARWMGKKNAHALGICMSLWAQELAAGRAFTNVPVEIVKRGADSTQVYINELKTSREIVFRRKICLVGPSCAGKTSLVKSITTKQPQLVHLDDRTIGIDHFPLRFAEAGTGNEKIKTHEVTFWDFAGQDAYQVAHSLFFSPRTLFLVCVDLEAFKVDYMQAVIVADAETQEIRLLDEFVEDSVMRWVRLIVARQPDAEFVFVATKEDALADNDGTKKLLMANLMAKLKAVNATVQQMRALLKQDNRFTGDNLILTSQVPIGVDTPEPTVVCVSCMSSASVKTARARIEDLVIQSKRGFEMPDKYTEALKAIVEMRQAASADTTTSRIDRVLFASVDTLPATLKMTPTLCTTILQTLHDLGDVLWYEDLGIELFQKTVILDPLLLIDFIRQVISHKHTGVKIAHTDLMSKPFWMDLSSEEQILAMKRVLQTFRLVYATGEMKWDSDLIVPAFWQTKTRAVWMFLGDMLRINTAREDEAVRVHWEYHFLFGLPPSLFDHVVVASVSPFIKFDAGPDWIMYKKEGVAASRIMVSRDPIGRHRTIHVEAVVAKTATVEQVDKLWESFQQLCGTLVTVRREYPGLAGVSSFAWDADGTKINMNELLTKDKECNWMPPAATWTWFKQLVIKSA